MLTPSLRTSGFLLDLPPEELQSFLLLLTFVTADGRIAPITAQLAEALHLSEAKTHGRLERLVKASWQGQPIVAKHDFGKGQHTYSPLHGLLSLREQEHEASPVIISGVSHREAIIERSRRLHARPRAEVEAEIARFLSRKTPVVKTAVPLSTQPHNLIDKVTPQAMPYEEPTTQQEPTPQPGITAEDQAYLQLKGALIQAGIYPEQAEELLAEYDHERIQRQLLWLPYRVARNPAGFLIAAIRNDYEAPLTVSHDTSISEEPAIETSALNKPDAE